MLLDEYREKLSVYQELCNIVSKELTEHIKQSGIELNAIETRLKKEKSLAGKLARKGSKYQSITDITDLVGARIIAFYNEDVDRIASIAEKLFVVDWNNSVDKRKMHQYNSFGYNSLHYICRLPKSVIDDPEMPELNQYRFELQMRTALQHVWSTIEHDTGYKGEVKIPHEYQRQFNRLAGMLELIDDEFSRLRTRLTDYRRQVQSLVASGQLDDVLLDSDSFKSYLHLKPFDRLNQRIAAVNQAEILPCSLLSFVPILQSFGFKTLGDVDRMITKDADDAYQLALSQLAFTDIDILSENVGLLNLCIVHILKGGEGLPGLKQFYNHLYGKQGDSFANIMMKQVTDLPFMHKKK